MTDGTPLLVVAAVIWDAGSVLACRRAPGTSSAGRWEFPGGKVEPGETREDALRREVREELAVDIRVGRLLTSDDTTVAGRVIRLACYEATLEGDRPVASTDHDVLEWVAPGDLPARDWAEPDLPAVRLLTATSERD